jgi:DDE superfamily endonuclease
VFLDESEALTHPYLARCWAQRGAELRIEAPGQAKKRAMLGAFDPVHRHLLVHTCATKRSTDFVALLDRLGAAYGADERARPLVAVLDNGPIHRSKLTTKALAERTWLTLEWLPKYVPELNDPGSRPGQAIERCWRDLKQHYLANRTFADPDALDRAIPDASAHLNHERQPHSSPILICPTSSASRISCATRDTVRTPKKVGRFNNPFLPITKSRPKTGVFPLTN